MFSQECGTGQYHFSAFPHIAHPFGGDLAGESVIHHWGHLCAHLTAKRDQLLQGKYAWHLYAFPSSRSHPPADWAQPDGHHTGTFDWSQFSSHAKYGLLTKVGPNLHWHLYGLLKCTECKLIADLYLQECSAGCSPRHWWCTPSVWWPSSCFTSMAFSFYALPSFWFFFTQLCIFYLPVKTLSSFTGTFYRPFCWLLRQPPVP